jgi:hypothetical protein
VPVDNHRAAPTIASVDEHNLVAISCFGDWVRVTATDGLALDRRRRSHPRELALYPAGHANRAALGFAATLAYLWALR